MTVHAQSNTILEIETKYAREQEMYELVNESNKLIQSNSNLALEKIEEALKISYDIDDRRGEAFSYQTLGVLQHQNGNYKNAIEYYSKANDIFLDIKDNLAYYKTIRYLAQAYEANGDLSLAEKSYRDVLLLAQQRKNAEDQVYAKESIARVLFNKKDFTGANLLYQQLLVMYRSANNEVKVNSMYEFIGKCYAGLKDTTNAVKYFEMAGGISTLNSTELEQRTQWQNVGRSYNSIGRYDKSVEYEKRAKKINTKNNDYQEVLGNNTNIANGYLFMNKANEAIPILYENINLSEEMGELRTTGENYKALSDAYAQLGKLEQAKESFDEYKRVQEELLDEREKEINELAQHNSVFDDKEKQIELLIRDKELDEKRIEILMEGQKQEEKNVAQQRRISYLMGALVLLLLIVVVFFYRSSRQKQLANKLLSIRSLRSQMNPHFIFNSLNSVNSFISKSDERSANKYLTEFARLMRTVLEHSKQDFVPLSAEIEVLQRYLNLEHIRFHDQFDYSFEVDDELEVERLLIPPMLVQPYVENAIWHGLRYKKEKGSLSVRFKDDDSGLVIQVEDDGIGRTRSKEIKTPNQKLGKSTGISNTAARLKLLNDVHSIDIKSELKDLNEDGTGTCVQIYVPFIDIDEKKYAESV
ncbi:MAG: histidine kinase [Bacteroidia bacterium]|nr:histidine kinase [Bacteroidia bacterium]